SQLRRRTSVLRREESAGASARDGASGERISEGAGRVQRRIEQGRKDRAERAAGAIDRAANRFSRDATGRGPARSESDDQSGQTGRSGLIRRVSFDRARSLRHNRGFLMSEPDLRTRIKEML